jgi:hypothetical protein
MVGGGSTLSPYKPQKSSFWSRSTYLVKRSRLGFAYIFVLVAVIGCIMMATLTPSFVRHHQSNSLGPGRRLRPVTGTAAVDNVPFSARGGAVVMDESHRALSSLTEDAAVELREAVQQDPQVQDASAELDLEPLDPLFPRNSGSGLDDSTVQTSRTQPKRRSIARMASVQPPTSSFVPNLVLQNELKPRASTIEQDKSADGPIKRASNGVEEKVKLMLERSRKRKNGASASKVSFQESTKSVLATGRAIVKEVIGDGMDAATEEITKLDFTHHVINESPLGIAKVPEVETTSLDDAPSHKVDSAGNSNLEPARGTDAPPKSKKADFRTAYIVRKNQSPRSHQVDQENDQRVDSDQNKDSASAKIESTATSPEANGEDKTKGKERSRKDRSQLLKRAAAAAGPRPKGLASTFTEDEAASAQESQRSDQVDQRHDLRVDNEHVKDSASSKVESTAKSQEANEGMVSVKAKTKKKERSRKDRSQILKRYAAAAGPRPKVLANTEDETAAAAAAAAAQAY